MKKILLCLGIYLSTTLTSGIFSAPAEASEFIKLYRKIGEAITRPDHTTSKHPVVTKSYIRPGVFIQTEDADSPIQISSIINNDMYSELEASIMKIRFSRKYYRLKNLKKFQEQKCLLNQSELATLSQSNILDIIETQNNEHTHMQMAKMFAMTSATDSLPINKGDDVYPYQKAFEKIRSFLGDSQLVIDRMLELQREILIIKKAHQDVDSALPLQEVLARWERHFGFNPAIILEPKLLSLKEWQAMLKSGSLFYDLYWEPRWYEPHGAETHRLQWHLVMRDILDNPESYGLTNHKELVEVYMSMGKSEVQKKLKWNDHVKSFERSLWYQTVDTEEINFTGPVLTRWTLKKMEGLLESK